MGAKTFNFFYLSLWKKSILGEMYVIVVIALLLFLGAVSQAVCLRVVPVPFAIVWGKICFKKTLISSS